VGACPGSGDPAGRRGQLAAAAAPGDLRWLRADAGVTACRDAGPAGGLGRGDRRGAGGAAAGLGCRTIAGAAGPGGDDGAGWLRRFAARAEPLRSAFTVLACELDADPLLPGPSGSAVADAVAAILAAALAAARRWGELASVLSPWELASAVSAGGLLSPGAAVQMINTSCLW